jgi:hypothetical protein
MLSWGVWDQAAGKMRLYPKNGTESGTGTTTALAFIPAVAARTSMALVSTTAFTNNWIAAVFGGDGFIPTPAEIAAVDNRLKSTLSVADALSVGGLLAKTTHAWQVGASWNPPATVSDSVGAAPFTMVSGSASTITTGKESPLWA